MPFTFFPVALCTECSRRFHRLRFLTFWLFLWRGFFCVVSFLILNSVRWCGCQSSVTESFANLKIAEIGQFGVFFLSPTCVLRLSSSFAVVCLTLPFLPKVSCYISISWRMPKALGAAY